eukprot:3657677-Prorocentrum_lima.AAC.1
MIDVDCRLEWMCLGVAPVIQLMLGTESNRSIRRLSSSSIMPRCPSDSLSSGSRMKLKSPPAIVDVSCCLTCWHSSCATVNRVLPNVYPCSMCILTMSMGKSGCVHETLITLPGTMSVCCQRLGKREDLMRVRTPPADGCRGILDRYTVKDPSLNSRSSVRCACVS